MNPDSDVQAIHDYREREKFLAKIRKFEAEARADPAAYQRKCERAVWLGYFLVVVSVLVLAAIVGITVLGLVLGRGASIWIGGAALVILVSILRALFRNPDDEASGIVLGRGGSPQFHQMVESVRMEIGGPVVHEIRIDMQPNASAAQIMRHGILGRTFNRLTFGAYYLVGLSMDEAKSVVAHELGHFAGDHGRFRSRMFAVAGAWEELSQAQGWAAQGFGSIFRPYVTWIHALRQPLQRINEFAADAAALQVAGEAAVSCEVRLHPLGLLCHVCEEEAYRLAEGEPDPPDDFVERLLSAIGEPPDDEASVGALERALTRRQDPESTHPVLAERLAALGVELSGPPIERATELWAKHGRRAEPSAWQGLFSEAQREAVVGRLQQEWERRMGDRWRLRHREVASDVARLLELNGTAIDQMDDATLEELLTTLVRVRGRSEARRLARAMVTRQPLHPLGNLVLADRDEGGDAYRRRLGAAATDPKLRFEAFSRLLEAAEEDGDAEEARRLYVDLDRFGQQRAAISREFTVVPEFGARAWSPEPERLGQLLEVLSNSKRFLAAYAIEHDSRLQPGLVHQGIYVIPRIAWFLPDRPALEKAFAELEDIPFDFVLIESERKKARRRFDCIPGARVWPAR